MQGTRNESSIHIGELRTACFTYVFLHDSLFNTKTNKDGRLVISSSNAKH